jgi:MspA
VQHSQQTSVKKRRLSSARVRRRQMKMSQVSPVMALLTALAMLFAPSVPPAWADADPADPAGAAPFPALPDGTIPSAAPAVATLDGWTLAVSADDEKQIPLPPVTIIANTGPLSRDVVVSGVFTGSIRGSASPEGTLEVGYEVDCGRVPGLMASLALPEQTSWNISVTEKKFTGPNPKVEISGYHVVINRCPGLAFIRSYAILTSTSGPSRVVAYYGVPMPVDLTA